jgi:GntR family transcriptional regulator, galactonate operon transcriptional repressor
MQHRKFHDRVVEALGRQIGGGIYRPGAPMPVEAALGEEFGVSRVVVREAVKALAAKGMVEVRPRTGTRVQPRERWNLLDPQVIAWRAGNFSAGGQDETFIADLMELRRIVEPPAVRLAAIRALPADLRALRAAFLDMQAAVEMGGDYVTADLAFHGAILTACHNQFVQQLHGALSEILKTSFSISSRDPLRPALSLRLHEDLLLGIERQDPEVASAAADRLIARAGEDLARELEAVSSRKQPPG